MAVDSSSLIQSDVEDQWDIRMFLVEGNANEFTRACLLNPEHMGCILNCPLFQVQHRP